jgi:uncharacterized protein (DUF4415 family)
MKEIDPYEDEPFDFSRARRVTPEEHVKYKKAVERKLGIKLGPRGRPAKRADEKYRPVYMRLHPKALAWAKQEAKRQGIGYQSVINQVLLRLAA